MSILILCMKAIYHNKKEREYEKNNHDYLSVLSMVWISACTAGVGEGESGSAVLPSQLPKNVVFKNGTIYTSNEKQDIVEAVAAKEGKLYLLVQTRM